MSFVQSDTVALLVRDSIGYADNTDGGQFYSGPDNYLLNMTADEVQQWNLQGSDSHPFHMHVNHVQFVNVDGPSLVPGWNHVGDWVDTVSSESTELHTCGVVYKDSVRDRETLRKRGYWRGRKNPMDTFDGDRLVCGCGGGVSCSMEFKCGRRWSEDVCMPLETWLASIVPGEAHIRLTPILFPSVRQSQCVCCCSCVVVLAKLLAVGVPTPSHPHTSGASFHRHYTLVCGHNCGAAGMTMMDGCCTPTENIATHH